MDQGVLVSGELSSGADLAQKLGMKWPVRAAFWLRKSDEDRGYLYIAIEGFAGASSFPVYNDVNRIARESSYPNFDHFRVNLIDANESMARAAIELNLRYPDPLGHRTGPKMFGDIFAEDLYVYPLPLPAAVG